MSEQQYQGTLASGGQFVADSQGIRILDPAGNQLASFGRDVISGINRDGQVVTVERHNDSIVTLTAASITDAVGLEQYVRDTFVAPPTLPAAAAGPAAAAAAPLAFDAIDDDDPIDQPPAEPPAPRPPIISRPETSEEGDTPPLAHDLPEPVPTAPQRSFDAPPPPVERDTAPVAPLPPSPPPPASYQATSAPPAAVDDGENGGGRRLWLWGCLGCGGLLILAIICFAVLIATETIDPDDFSDDDATPTPFVIVATPEDDGATATESDGGSVEPTATANDGGDVEPTATPNDSGGEPTATSDDSGGSEPTATTGDGGETPTGDVMSAGETGSLGGMNVTFVSSRTDSGGVFPPDAGNEYLILLFRIENTTAESVTISSLLQFELYDDQGNEVDISLFADYEQGVDVDVPAGETIEGEVAFEVPTGGGSYTVTYTEAFGEEALTWAV